MKETNLVKTNKKVDSVFKSVDKLNNIVGS